MAKAIQFRRGSTAEHSAFTGLVGEVTVDTDKDTLVVHDGSTAGGHPIAKSGTNTDITSMTALTSLAVTGTAYSSTITLTDGATIAWNTASGQVAKVTLAGNRTVNAPTNLQDGGFYSLEIIQDATGSRTLAWNSVFKFTGAIAPTLSTDPNSKDYIVFRSDGTNLYEQGRSLGVA
jgi:hypothetical protein